MTVLGMKRFAYAAAALCFLSIAAGVVLLSFHAAALLDRWAALPDRIASLQNAVERLPAQVIPLVTKPVLAEVDKQAAGLRGDLVSQVDKLREEAMGPAGQVAGLRSDAIDIASMLASPLGEASGAIQDIRSGLKPAVASLAAASAKAADIAAHVDDALPAFTDCAYLDSEGTPVGGNEDCLFNRYQGLSKSAEETMRAVAIAAPQLGKEAVDNGRNVALITGNIETLTKAVTKPKGFFGRVWAGISALSRFAALL